MRAMRVASKASNTAQSFRRKEDHFVPALSLIGAATGVGAVDFIV
ncbi:hypothetical protein EKH55_0166 [Sinorhizobium alkalisoli]|nr:hypothetical protein EKH55_0166 [Sinorhizobium alkalisoli]